jgi:hypothetical protein
MMVFNATFNNISVILRRSVLCVEETGENHQHRKTLSQCCIEYTLPLEPLSQCCIEYTLPLESLSQCCIEYTLPLEPLSQCCIEYTLPLEPLSQCCIDYTLPLEPLSQCCIEYTLPIEHIYHKVLHTEKQTAKTLKLLGFSFVLEKNHVGNGRCLPEMHGLSFVVTKGLSIPHYREEYELILFSTYIDNLIVMKKLTYKPFPN